jgi:molecular chaperone HscB
MDPLSLCWQCGQPEVCELVCPACKALQKPPAGFFQFFGLNEQLALDTAALQIHPDLHTLKTEHERACSLEAASILNDGYRILRDPVLRAEYVMKNHGMDIGEQRGNNVPSELLEEVFELNEALEEVRGGDDTVRPRLAEADVRFREMLGEVDRELEREFRNYDASPSDDVLRRIRGILNRRRYIQNLVAEVQKELV